MTRKDIEKNIIDVFTQRISANGVILIDSKITGADHYALYEFFVNGLRYELSVIFIKPNFIKAKIYLRISSRQITDLLNSVQANAAKEYFIANITMNSYLIDEHREGIYKTVDEYDIYVDEKPMQTIDDIAAFVNEMLVGKVFRPIWDDVVPKTDSLQKLDYLFNDLPYVGNNGSKPFINVYTTYLINQVLTGTLLAIATERQDKAQLFARYLDYASKFEPGEHLPIDLMRKAIAMYG